MENPFVKERQLKNGVILEMAEEDFEYFQSYVNAFNNFEAIAKNENMDLKNGLINDRIRQATLSFHQKRINLDTGIKIVKNEAKAPRNNVGGNNAPQPKPRG